ncbi:SH3 beta-barrel fold-containing protein [bacterium]|jgi:hypothetical protein|nr:SH3 beta-barrel fold-containing protein [bacterium]
MNTEEFLNYVKNNVATVEFRKVGTDELRVMPCTLNAEVMGEQSAEVTQQANNDHLVVWSMDKDAWRSFRVNTVERWYEGYPSGN